jgi:hypothetical protein
VAIDCDRDPEGFGFWLAKAAGSGYVAQREYKNGEVPHKLGENLVDVDYYARLNPSKPLDFEHEAPKETVKATQLLPVGHLAVETSGFEGQNARLSHAS